MPFTKLLFAIVWLGIVHIQGNIASPLRIINGTDARVGEFPYVVSLRVLNSDDEEVHYCGGSIISRQWILTAGHCLDQNISFVRAGQITLDDFSTNHQTSVLVDSTYLYPEYSEDLNAINDLGLIKLATPLNLSSTIQTIALSKRNASIPFNSLAWVAGWGMVNESNYEPSEILQKVELTLFPDELCYHELEDYSSTMNFCAGNLANTKGHCSGDSGGPLVVNGALWGIVSWSIKPCISAPGVYTRLANTNFRNWIAIVTGI